MGASDLQCFMLNHPRTSFQGMRGATYTQDVELTMDANGIVIKNEKHSTRGFRGMSVRRETTEENRAQNQLLTQFESSRPRTEKKQKKPNRIQIWKCD